MLTRRRSRTHRSRGATTSVTLRAVETYLRESGIPYVEVDRGFHFIAYCETGPNLLVTCRPFSRPGVRDAMQIWQGIFGTGFVAAEVRVRKGRFVFVALDGTVIESAV